MESKCLKILHNYVPNEDLRCEFDQLISDLVNELHKELVPFYEIKKKVTKVPSYSRVKKLSISQKGKLLIHCLYDSYRLVTETENLLEDCNDTEEVYKYFALNELGGKIVRMKLELTAEELMALLRFYREKSNDGHPGSDLVWAPLLPLLNHVSTYLKTNDADECLVDFLNELGNWPELEKFGSLSSEADKVKDEVKRVLHNIGDIDSPQAFEFNEEDAIGRHFNEMMKTFPHEQMGLLFELLHICQKATSSKPTKKFLDSTKKILQGLDIPALKALSHNWITCMINPQDLGLEYYKDNGYGKWNSLVAENNTTALKGLIWSLAPVADKAIADDFSHLVQRVFPQRDHENLNSKIGNACLYSLANAPGLYGISQLSRLKLKITQQNTKKLIEKYLVEGARERGITAAELEDIAAPSFGLFAGGYREEEFGDYGLVLSLTGIGKTELSWIAPNGKPQKSTPAHVKSDSELKERLKMLKAEIKQIQQHSTAQRDRIDRSFTENRQWRFTDFQTYYLNHGLVSFIARRLIWVIDMDGTSCSAIWRNDQWEDVSGKEFAQINEKAEVRLWHPLMVSMDEVLQWRKRLEALDIRQPVKQAFREVYLLTDAEKETGTYSNRMAAHLLKQRQFKALTGVRGWKYRLMGIHDDGRDGEIAKKTIDHLGLTCEYYINEVQGDHEDDPMETWTYVSTDQIRYVDGAGNAVALKDVPNIVFSEIMRDIDLFVGVASVGNDPEWLDRGGVAEFRDYWSSYSFGDLTELAKTRKLVLEHLLPKLKISGRARIDGNFLRVKGSIREYKIHIGSSNILMEPNDQYLCIVPSRGEFDPSEKLYLPFEGDRGLSIVISKALLLADDQKITDPSILSQIKA